MHNQLPTAYFSGKTKVLYWNDKMRKIKRCGKREL